MWQVFVKYDLQILLKITTYLLLKFCLYFYKILFTHFTVKLEGMENLAFYLSLLTHHNAFMEGGGYRYKDIRRYFKEQISKRFRNSLQSDKL